MNYKMIFHMLGVLLLCLAALMLLPLVVGLCFGESVRNFLIPIGISALAGGALFLIKPDTTRIFAREGFAIVSLSWIVLSLVGALPYVLSGDIPNYIDAVFETVSGFTTTGATIIDNVEAVSKAGNCWRCFSHWIGGMGVLVFIMAILPMSGEHSMHIMRAEVPGPVVGKLVPRAKKTAATLYIIYIVLTLAEAVLLKLGGMSFYEAMLHAFSTAGTGGFSTRAASIAGFNSVYIEIVIATFMLIFSVNFSIYFLLLHGRTKEAFKNEELRVFLCIVLGAVLLITIGIAPMYGGFLQGLRHAYFNVASIVSTTGFGTEDFTRWPEYTCWVILLLMFIGGCAGSTAGGMKLSRVVVAVKTVRFDFKQMLHPRSVNIIRLDGQRVEDSTVKAILTYFALYIITILICAALISFDNLGITTSFTASLACLSNIGPGMAKVGPAGNYTIFSQFSKIVLSAEMLLGRLEIYPLIIFLSGIVSRKKN